MRAEALCGAVLHGENWLADFRIKTYEAAFAAYRAQYGPLFKEALLETGGRDGAVNALAAEILDELERSWKRCRLWDRAVARAETKQLLVDYLSPMLLELETPGAQELCRYLRDGWTARRPRDAYRIASYEMLLGGFKNAIMGLEINRKKEAPPKDFFGD